MRIEQIEHLPKAALDLRRRRFAGADEPDATGHARAHLIGELPMFVLARLWRAHPRDAAGRGALVDLARPAIMEHPFVAPLVAEFLDQDRREARHGIVGVD